MGFQKVCLYWLIFFFWKLKSILKKLKFHVSTLNVRQLDPSTHLLQFDANSAKIQYMSDPKTLFWSKSTLYNKGYEKYKLFDLNPLNDMFSIPSTYLFWGGLFDSTIIGTTLLICFCHFAGQISYPFDFISWPNLLVEFYGNGRPVDAISRQAWSQKFKVLDLHNITSSTLSRSPANA